MNGNDQQQKHLMFKYYVIVVFTKSKNDRVMLSLTVLCLMQLFCAENKILLLLINARLLQIGH